MKSTRATIAALLQLLDLTVAYRQVNLTRMSVYRTRDVASGGKARFAYDELLHPQEIRIIWLHPGNDLLEVKSDLSTIYLDFLGSNDQNEAISYVWGRADDGGAMIICNGRSLDITISLYKALRRFRLP